ncbi:MAG: MlaD family protein [Baekduia sp.]
MRRNAITANPVLIGAATALVVLVAVLLSYNANRGLPFVPTYSFKVELPSAANLVPGNEVRLGANRIGLIDGITAKRLDDGQIVAEVSVKIEDRLRPLPQGTQTRVRFKSALGLKYLELTRPDPAKRAELPDNAFDDLPQGGLLPLSQSNVQVEFDEAFAWADEKTRANSQKQLTAIGDALAGRGEQLNDTIAGLAPLLEKARPVAETLADPDSKLAELLQGFAALSGEIAPVADQQANLFVGLDDTFSALASVARPYLQDSITEWPVLEQTLIDELPKQRPFLRHSTELFAELRPATRALAKSSKDIGDAAELAGPALEQSITLNERLKPTLRELEATSKDPLVRLGIRDLRLTTSILDPLLAHVTPVQTVCNYGSLFFLNAQSALSIGDTVGTSLWTQIVIPPDGPNNELGPAPSPANGGGTDPRNFLHSNPYPNTAAPGQEKECEPGNEPWTGRVTIGNPVGNQGTTTRKTTKADLG